MRRSLAAAAVGVAWAIAGCIAAPPAAAHDLAHLLIVAPTAALAVFVPACLYQARRHYQLARGMLCLAKPGTLAGQPVELVMGLSAPVVAGLWMPRIFCGHDLGTRLDEDELRAVVLHEQHHLRDRAALRLVVLAALVPILGRTLAGRAWLERERARIEIVADAYALAQGVSRPVIASALLKLSTDPRLASAPGFVSAADLRIRALLGEPTGLELEPGRAGTVSTAALLVAACLVVYLR